MYLSRYLQHSVRYKGHLEYDVASCYNQFLFVNIDLETLSNIRKFGKMRIWVLVTTLLVVSILTTEVFGKESKFDVDEIRNENQDLDKNKKETIKSESKKEKGKEEKHLQEQNKPKKKKRVSSSSFEINPEVTDSVGSKGSKKARKTQKSNQTTKPNNKQRKQEEQLEARNTIDQKVRHEKEKYKNKGINGQVKNNKKQNKRLKKDLKHVNEIEQNIESDNKKSEDSNLDVVIENNKLRKKHKLNNVIEEIDLTIDNKSNSDRKKWINKNKCSKCKGEKVVEESNVSDNEEEETGKITKKKKKRNVDSKVNKKSKKLSHGRKELPTEDNEHEYKEGKEKSTSTSVNEVEYDENKNAEEENNCYKKEENNHGEENIDKEIYDV